MIDQELSGASRSAINRLSRSTVGRVSVVAARLFGSMSTIQSTGRFLRRQLWAWPIIAAVLFGGAGFWVHQSVESQMRQQRATDLNVIVNASATALRAWVDEQKVSAQLIADDEQLRPIVVDLLQMAAEEPRDERRLVQSKAQEALRDRLKAAIAVCGYVGYSVVSPEGVVLAAEQDPPIGKELTGYRLEVFQKAMEGQTLVSKPYRSPLLLVDEKGELRANLPTMFTISPILDGGGKPIAVLGLRIRPDDQFTRILQVTRYGNSGETFAFDEKGVLLSQSRFDDLMKQIGLLADQPDSQSILTVEVRDPGVDMVAGERPTVRRAEQPLTRMAAEAVQGKDGHDADGYRSYRGVLRVGAWRWLNDLDFGIATEIDAAEAFQPVVILRKAFWVLMALLALFAIGIFAAMLFIARQQKALQKATLIARKLGQYTMEEKLGSGGMGTVYRARHAMLRRPTAVKLLDVDKMSEAATARFEREVQLTSALTHPNTVAVFDFGRTPDGILYYAMEFLDGMNLDQLVSRFGPLTEARTIFILQQVCGSLAEAHAAGLVHRDVKPANVLLTHRGGLYDFVKVVDFGLARALESSDGANITSPNAVMGTPLYLSPESINQPDSVDARSDVYAVGAVGYFLLTGTPVFTGTTIMEICMKHTREAPQPPSARRGQPISAALEALILRCLAKSPADRPRSASELLRELNRCKVEGEWTSENAAEWWAAYTKRQSPAAEPARIAELDSAQLDETTAFHPS